MVGEVAGEAAEEVVAERGVLLALAAQAGAVELDRAHVLDDARRQAASGTAARATTSRRSRRGRPSTTVTWPRFGHVCLERDEPVADEEERVGVVALAEEPLARVDGDVLPAAGDRARASPGRDRRRRGSRRSELVKRVAWRSPPRSRIARTSSRMSMPTGHQAMQRPHPTQPSVPNWSCHVASLCVSHWR